MKTINNRRGAAIVIAIFFAFCMLIILGSMLFRQSSTSGQNQKSLLNQQAFFAARSAMQHFLLKAKLFPTELYDAVEISQGKNPLFNFTEFSPTLDDGNEAFEEYQGRPNVYVKRGSSELDSNGKPRYFYVKLPGKNTFVRLASYYNPDYRFLAPNLSKAAQDVKYTEPEELPESYKPQKYLAYYFRDCSNRPFKEKGFHPQPGLKMTKSTQISNINKFDIATRDGYPYTLDYSVIDVNVKAIQGMKKYGEEAIEISVEGNVKNFQNKEASQFHQRIQKITRKGSIE